MPVGVILTEVLLESNIFRKVMLLYYRSLSILRLKPSGNQQPSGRPRSSLGEAA